MREEAATLYKPQIGVLGGKEDPGLALPPSKPRAYKFCVDNMLYCITDEASATSDKDDGFWLLNGHERRDGMVRASNAAGRLLFNIPHTDHDLRLDSQTRYHIPTPWPLASDKKHSTTAAARRAV